MTAFGDPVFRGSTLDSSLADLLDSLAAAKLASPAGNSAALCGALAAALTAAIARNMHTGAADGAVAQADALRARLGRLAEGSGAAHYRAVRLLERAETGSPDDGEGDLRDKELASALGEAADYPLRICEAAADVATLAGWIARDGPQATRADALAAACMADAAVSSAAALVEANLAVTGGDDRTLSARAHVDASRAVRRSLESRDN